MNEQFYLGLTFIADGGDYGGQRVTVCEAALRNPETGDVEVWKVQTPDGELWPLPHWRLVELRQRDAVRAVLVAVLSAQAEARRRASYSPVQLWVKNIIEGMAGFMKYIQKGMLAMVRAIAPYARAYMLQKTLPGYIARARLLQVPALPAPREEVEP